MPTGTVLALSLSLLAAILLEWLALTSLGSLALPLLAVIAAAIPALMLAATWTLARIKPGIFSSLRQAGTQKTGENSPSTGFFPERAFHDLRAPVRGIDGFATALEEDYGNNLDDTGRDYLRRIRSDCGRLRGIIDGLQQLDSSMRRPLALTETDLSAIAEEIIQALREAEPGNKVETVVQSDLSARTDPGLIRILLAHLIGNAWKFTRDRPNARIEIKTGIRNGKDVFMVNDSGAGFDMAYAAKLFEPFQRLHDPSLFPGNGLGLYTARKILERLGGEIWAAGEENRGAVFSFFIPQDRAKR